MYQPPHFREDCPEKMRALIADHPLGLLITNGPAGIMANPIPLFWVEGGERGLLRGHLAKANPQLAELRAGKNVLVVFQGPDAYISPSWYASKAEHGRVVPTWNYVMVQARGVASVIDDAAWLRRQVDRLTGGHEDQRPQPWRTDDAPERFVQGQLKGITGVEISVSHLSGKWKASQNRSHDDRIGVVKGLRGENQHAMAGEIPTA